MSKGSQQRPTDPASFAANYDRIFAKSELYDDRREALRAKHLAEAQGVIHNAPPLSDATRERIDRMWEAFDAAYPQPLDLKPNSP